MEGTVNRSIHSTDIKKKRLEWIGHVVRMDRGRSVKKYLTVNSREVEEKEDLE